MLSCLVMMGSYFSYDNPQALQTDFQDPDGKFHLSPVQFNLLYSVYSFPNIVLPFFGGLLIDKIGSRIGVFMFSFVLIIGQLIFTWGVYKASFPIMIVGRIVFGLGGESLTVAQSTIVSQWFKGKELAFALGFNVSIARLGSSLNSIATPWLAHSTGKTWLPVLCGVFMCAASWVCGLLLNWMDKESDRREGVAKGSMVADTEKIQLSDLKNLRLLYWLLLINCLLIYGSFFGFTNNANDLLHQTFGFTNKVAGNLITIVYVTSAVVTPVMGLLTDKLGKRSLSMLLSTLLLIAAHSIMAFSKERQPVDGPNYMALLPLALIGIFYATYAAVFWPCVPLVVEEKTVGTAFGVITAFQNGMLALNPLMLGVIQSHTQSRKHGYYWSEIALGGLGVIGLLNSIWIYFNDKMTGNALWRVHAVGAETGSTHSKRRSMYASFRN